MRANIIISVAYDTKSTCNIDIHYDNDSAMCASLWFEVFGGLFNY